MAYEGGQDLGQALQNLISSIINALTSVFTAFAQWIQQNAGLVATIIGFTMLATGVIALIRRFGGNLSGFVSGLLRF